VKVLVLGATGYGGEAIALALRRAGHKVWGLVRDTAKASNLINNEVLLVVGDALKPDTYVSYAEKADVIINAANEFSQFFAFEELVRNVLLPIAQKGRKVLIHTSGSLVYKDSEELIDENSPRGGEGSFKSVMDSRIQTEDLLLADKQAHGVIVRPGFFVGTARQQFFVDYFSQAKNGAVVSVGPLDAPINAIHVEDLAAMYVKIVEAPVSLVSGQAFNAVDGSPITHRQLAQAFGRTAGFKGEVTFDPSKPHPFAEALKKRTVLSNAKAIRVLGWQPRHENIIKEAEIYYAVWQSNQDKAKKP